MLTIRVQTGSGAHPASYPVGIGDPYPGGKEREADHSLLSTAEIMNAWSYTSTPPIHLHGVMLD